MYFSSGSCGFTPDFKTCFGFPSFVALIINFVIPIYFNFKIAGKCIHHGDTYAVKSSGNPV